MSLVIVLASLGLVLALVGPELWRWYVRHIDREDR